MAKTKIEWTDASWNPVTGCDKISIGCQNCYAERMARRLQSMGNNNYKNGFKVTLHHSMLDLPLQWKTPRKIFVNSMSDLFHDDIPFEYIQNVFSIMKRAKQHFFQVLTKRAERLSELAPYLEWTNNIWMGVTVENADFMHRIEILKNVPAKIKFISCEPLLSAMPELPLDNINWVIVGGESGPHARPISKSWVVDIKNQCVRQNVSFFFKQWGGVNKKKNGRELDGIIWNQCPYAI